MLSVINSQLDASEKSFMNNSESIFDPWICKDSALVCVASNTCIYCIDSR